LGNYPQFNSLLDASPSSTTRIIVVKIFVSSFNIPKNNNKNFTSKTMYGIVIENKFPLIFFSRLVVHFCVVGWEALTLIVVYMRDHPCRSAS
jgi:hypothetical protein